MSRSLIIVRAGRGSLHEGWLGGGARDWDLWICPYLEVGFAADSAQGVYLGAVIPGAKWTGLRQLLESWGGWRAYDYVMLADDDLDAPAATWSAFFDAVRSQGALLAQPAQTPDSLFDHVVTRQNPNFSMRRTSFVEIMTPCFRVDALAALLPTFALTQTGWGWGLDYLWAKLLDYRGLLIVDDAAVRHTRPVGGGMEADTRRRAGLEMRDMLARIGASKRLETLEGLTRDGRWLVRDSREFQRLYLDGYWSVAREDPRHFASLMHHQYRVAAARV